MLLEKSVLLLLQKSRIFTEGQNVAIRNLQFSKQKWIIGKTISKDGILNYTVLVNGNLWRRHVDEIRPVVEDVTEVVDVAPTRPFELRKSNNGEPVLAEQVLTLKTSKSAKAKTPEPLSVPTNAANVSTRVPQHAVDAGSPRRSSRIRRPPKKMDL